jgi:hypothetical protein
VATIIDHGKRVMRRERTRITEIGRQIGGNSRPASRSRVDGCEPPHRSQLPRVSRENRSKLFRDGFLEMTQLPVFENGHLTVGDIQVAVVVNEHMR